MTEEQEHLLLEKCREMTEDMETHSMIVIVLNTNGNHVKFRGELLYPEGSTEDEKSFHKGSMMRAMMEIHSAWKEDQESVMIH